ncbi:ABC transporter substrate-binding protein [Vallitalea sp.]|uniref:ABC transporter substrate-binding protein n=1 Tax=Vallitalea sp. TaxID=1882829 RepID=UPI0025F554A1|nr:ABC transporter substrate-binding protein [Vallitalea sp.]MCT4686591.1 ABC transporter substrate-binding protein [Vallitalea sp.]
MRRKLVSLVVLITVALSAILSGCNNKSNLTTVRLNEVVHSIFYAPQYVAIEKGFFEDEGLDIELTTGWGAVYFSP